eukprot:TRINITY_DN7476_c0_g1_i1.p1 TRINITY_DN7476_c0_g1~~TRINITY_DN7476_c0_g1_i1.p1  ORF type:complete len:233 (+),score=65.06 TRINITY_DN7476_c0_g1_i1:125-823(+)
MSDEIETGEAQQPSAEVLEKRLKEILEHADLHSMSMKKLRSQLEEEFQVDLQPRAAEVQQMVIKALDFATRSREAAKTNENEDNEDNADDEDPAETDDFELAKRLQEEESTKEKRTLRTRAPEKKTKSKRTKKTAKEGEKKVQKNNPFNSPCYLSPTLADLLGVPTLSRPQVVKKIWEHIKENGLQDQSDKRFINCDDKMEAVFGVKRVHMFKMNKILSKHLKITGDVVAES